MDNIDRKTQDNAIVIIRVVAMFSIVLCHFLQGFNIKSAYFFNVGVQIFFLISGFLYGQKRTYENVGDFVYSRFKNVYLPYLVYVLIICPIIILLDNSSFRYLFDYIVNIQGFTGGVDGLNHLWFLTPLMICYVITPPLAFLLRKKTILTYVALAIICIVEFIFVRFMYSYCAWILCYMIGMIMGTDKKCIKYVMVVALVGIVVLLLLNGVKMLYDTATGYVYIWGHVFFSLVFFTLMYIINRSNIERNSFKLWNVFDRYSYSVYLTHHCYLLGPLSLLTITGCICCNILIVIIAIATSSIILYKLTNYIKTMV